MPLTRQQRQEAARKMNAVRAAKARDARATTMPVIDPPPAWVVIDAVPHVAPDPTPTPTSMRMYEWLVAHPSDEQFSLPVRVTADSLEDARASALDDDELPQFVRWAIIATEPSVIVPVERITLEYEQALAYNERLIATDAKWIQAAEAFAANDIDLVDPQGWIDARKAELADREAAALAAASEREAVVRGTLQGAIQGLTTVMQEAFPETIPETIPGTDYTGVTVIVPAGRSVSLPGATVIEAHEDIDIDAGLRLIARAVDDVKRGSSLSRVDRELLAAAWDAIKAKVATDE